MGVENGQVGDDERVVEGRSADCEGVFGAVVVAVPSCLVGDDGFLIRVWDNIEEGIALGVVAGWVDCADWVVGLPAVEFVVWWVGER